MLNKIYELVKKNIKENYKFIVLFIVLFIIINIPLPYYINFPGGTINISDRIKMDTNNRVEGSFNLAYVSEIKAVIPTLLYAIINPDWKIYKQSEVINDNETTEEDSLRSKLMLEESIQNAIYVGYSKSNSNIDIISRSIYVIYISDDTETNLKIGDRIISVDDILIEEFKDIKTIVNSKEIGDKILFKVKRDDKTTECYGIIKNIDDSKLIGISFSNIMELNTDPKINFNFKSSESGPSGGLMLSLSIYNYLVNEDITKGNTIAGTGTIDIYGNVGEIGGIEHKIKGVIKDKIKVFMIPLLNYEEAKEIVDKNNYDLKLIPISTFDEALKKLNEL